MNNQMAILLTMVGCCLLTVIVAAWSGFKLGKMSRERREHVDELDKLVESMRQECGIPLSKLDETVSGVELGRKRVVMPARDSRGRFLPNKKAVE